MSKDSSSRKSISGLRRDGSGKVYNKFHKKVKSRSSSTKTKLRFVERSKYEKRAMSRKERRSCTNVLRNLSFRLRVWFGNFNLLSKIIGDAGLARNIHLDESHEKADNDDDDDPVQFKVHKIVSLRSYARDLCTSDYHSRNYVLVLHKLSYSSITIVSFVGFIMLVTAFAFLYVFVSNATERCIVTSFGSILDSEEVTFGVAFSLSWVTITTLGYGHIVPVPSERKMTCAAMESIAFLESFLGVIYAGICGAVFYSRLMKSLDQAEVSFSNIICLRRNLTRCPTLELRIVNNLANLEKGEIIDASINCLVSKGLWSSNYEDDIKVKRSRSSQKLNRVRRQPHFRPVASRKFCYSDLVDASNPEIMSITNPNLPYFERIWMVRHVLDVNSPLLLPEIRNRISMNGGEWPDDILQSSICDCFAQFKEMVSGIFVNTALVLICVLLLLDCNIKWDFCRNWL